eukprot:gene13078-15094_t
MASSYSLGQHFEAFVQQQLVSGRYNNASEVIRDALRLMEDRDRRLLALDASIERGVADLKDGRIQSAEKVFDRLEKKYKKLANHIAAESPRRAFSFISELRSAVLSLATFPNAYPLLPRFERHGVRRKTYGDYLIFYIVEPNRLVILHILHGAQDYELIMFPD